MTTTEILGKFCFYTNASAAMRKQIAAAATVAQLPAGAMFYHQGARCDHFALLGQGSIRVFRVGDTGREITLYHVRDGETCLVNMLSVFLHQPTAASAQIEAAVEAVLIPGDAVRQWAREEDSFRNFIFETMGLRLISVMTLVEAIAFRKMDSRLADYLVRRFDNNGSRLRVFSATHEEIAAELGTAREVVSRVLKEFERRGAIGIARGRIELGDESVLRGFSQA